MRLTDIGLQYGTDKAEHHGFTDFYEEYFSKFSEPSILEVGILDGASLKMYADYFHHKAFIVGIDINNKQHLSSPMIGILMGDVLNPDSIKECEEAVQDLGAQYDIIIDDGGHYMNQQQLTLKNLWHLLKPGGIFIIEDLHTSGMVEYNPDNTTSTLDVLGGMRDRRYKESLYLNEQEQKTIVAEISDIKIWSKERHGQQGQALQSSITSVIVKAGINNKKLVSDAVNEDSYPAPIPPKYELPLKKVYVFEPTESVFLKNQQKQLEDDLNGIVTEKEKIERGESFAVNSEDVFKIEEEADEAHIEEHLDVETFDYQQPKLLGVTEDELTIERIVEKQLELQAQYERLESIKAKLLAES